MAAGGAPAPAPTPTPASVSSNFGATGAAPGGFGGMGGDIDAATLAAIKAAQGGSDFGGGGASFGNLGGEDPSVALARRLQSQEQQKNGQAQVRKPDAGIKKDKLIADAGKFRQHPGSMVARQTRR